MFSSDWTPHPLNPIISDCKSARPAGKIFSKNGTLYRPSQNCSTRYGYGFNVSEITSLDESRYSEELVSSVKPNWDKRIIGTHTLNHVNSLHIIDAIGQKKPVLITQPLIPIPKVPTVSQFVMTSGIMVWVPENGGKCDDSPLPCTQSPDSNLKLIDGKNIMEGYYK